MRVLALAASTFAWPALGADDPGGSLVDPTPLSSRDGPIRTLGDWGQYLNPAAAALIALSEDDPEGAGQLAKGCALTIAATHALKWLFNFTPLGQRPTGGDSGFPSGHTSAAMCAPAFVHARYREARYTLPLAAGGSFVGYSRIWARKHHWRDVLASTALAFAVLHNATERRRDDRDAADRQIAAAQAFGGLGPRGLVGDGRAALHAISPWEPPLAPSRAPGSEPILAIELFGSPHPTPIAAPSLELSGRTEPAYSAVLELGSGSAPPGMLVSTPYVGVFVRAQF